MAASGGDVDKAVIFGIDGGGSFEVQYNPVNLQFDKQSTWNEKEVQGKVSSLEYQKNNPAQLSFELHFDTTKDNADVRTAWVNRLLELTRPQVCPSEGQGGQIDKLRPPQVGFYWGQFEFVGAVENVSATYLMFSSNGTPLRAKVSVKLKEWKPKDESAAYATSGGSTGFGSAPVKLVTLKAGETITAVALRNGTTTQAICDANGITDPMNVPPGTQMAVQKFGR